MKKHEEVTEEEEIARLFDDTEKAYQAKVTGRHAVTLPAELCRGLEILPGDHVEFRLKHGVVTMRRAGGPKPIAAMGILQNYRYESMEAMIREIRDGRGTWTAEDEAEYQRNRHSEPVVSSGE